MKEGKSKIQLYINMPKDSIPIERLNSDGSLAKNQSTEYLNFWAEEDRKVWDGITIDGFHFSGWLYWHLNHWWLRKAKIMPNGIIVPSEGRPDLRDNELIIDDGLIKAQDPTNRRHLIILGPRRAAKTSFEASFLGRSGLIYRHSENLVLSTNTGDLNNITTALDFGLLNCSKYFYIPRITKDWNQERVVLGTESKRRDRTGLFSQYVLRNTSSGIKTEVGAGVTITSGVLDEIGKAKFLEAFKAVEKAMLSEFGIRAVFILVGTGGSFEDGADAQAAFFEPDGNKFVKYIQPDGRESGLFISGLFRPDCKVKTTVGAYLQTEDARLILGDRIPKNIPEDSELFKTIIYVADKELALKKILEDRATARLNPNSRLYLKTVAYDPLTVDEIFLTDSNNPFNDFIDEMKTHKYNLLENYKPRTVHLYRNPDDTIGWTFSDKLPILEFPTSPKTYTDAPVIIYEEPIKDVPFWAYVCGIDPYNQDKSSDSNPSLGVCYIFKRMYDPMGQFQDSIVCSYAGRPSTLTEFYKICEMMIDMYGAIALPENEGSIIQYFITRKKEHVLFDSPALTRYVNPNSATQSRQKGFAATTPHQRHYMKLMYEYFGFKFKENLGGHEYERFGLVRIPDPMLIAEAQGYRGKTSNAIRGVHDGNFDRICFIKGHNVRMKDGYKDISLVNKGDLVLTHCGGYQPVTNTIERDYSGSLFSIRPIGNSKPILCTEEHPFYTASYTHKPGGRSWFKRKANLDKREWKKAKDLTQDDFLLIPASPKCKRPLDLSDDALYVIGWYLGDGNISKAGRLRIVFQGDQLDMALKVKYILEANDKFEPTYFTAIHHVTGKSFKSHTKKLSPKITKCKDKYAYYLECTSDWFNTLITKYIILKTGGEKIIGEDLFNSSDLIPLILGYMEADGSQAFSSYDSSVRSSLTASGTYITLMNQIRSIILNEGIWCTISQVVQKSVFNNTMQLRIDIQDWEGINRIVEGSLKFSKVEIIRKQRQNFIKTDEGFWIPVSKVSNFPYKGKVYNIEVSVDNSYTIDTIAVHNCAFGHALTLANYLDRDYPVLGKLGKREETRSTRIYSPFPIHEHDNDHPHIYNPFAGMKGSAF